MVTVQVGVALDSGERGQAVLVMRTLLTVFGALAFATTAFADGSSSSRATEERTTSSARATTRASAALIDQAVRAVRTAERSRAGSRAYDVEAERFRGRPAWEVDVALGTRRAYEVIVQADGRRILRERRKARVGGDARLATQARVGLAEAIRSAARRVAPQDAFHEAEIERWRGRLVWEATFARTRTTEVEVRVDAGTGAVVAVEIDD